MLAGGLCLRGVRLGIEDGDLTKSRGVFSYRSLDLWLVIGIILLAAAMRFIGLGVQSFWFDEAFTVVATRLPIDESLSALLTLGAYTPFYYLLQRPITAILGQSEFAYRFSSACFGVLAIPLLYRVGRLWLGRWAGLLASFALAVCPFHLLYSQDGRMYAMTAFFSLAAMYDFDRVLRGEGWRSFIFTSALAYLSHYAAVFLIYVQLLCLFPLVKRRYRLFRHWFGAQMMAILPLIPWMSLYLWTTREARSIGIGWIPRPNGFTLVRTLWNFNSGDTDTWTAWVMVLMATSLIILARGMLALHRVRYKLICWLFLPLLVNFAVSLRQPLYVDRYFIGSLPAYILLLVAGILRVMRSRRLLGIVAIILVIGVMVWGSARILSGDPYFAKEDWRGATAAVDTGLAMGDIVVLQDYETLIGTSAYRTQEWPLLVLEPGWEAVMLTEAMAQHDRVWLIWRSPYESNHRLCKSDPFDVFAEASLPVRVWLAGPRQEAFALNLKLPGITVVLLDVAQ